jgi:phosphoglycolate phosphatase
MTEPTRTLVLWDVDHTLIETRGVGRAIYDRVFPAVTGKPLVNLAQIAGRTELDIMRESLRVNGVEPTEEAIQQLAEALVEGYIEMTDELAARGRALPGVQKTLAALAVNPQIHQGVLTGNLRDVARIKLEVFGLDQYLDLDASAYGDDHASRPRLVQIAQRRATERTGMAFDNSRTVLVGDTPNDVQAALTAGIRVIAVTTGKSTEDELRASGAVEVIPGLTPEMINLLKA